MTISYKKLIIIAGIIFLFNSSQAQDGIDTALFKQYKVKKMWVWVKLPIFEKRSMNDSCKVEIYEFDTLNRITYQFNGRKCYGWSGSTNSYNSYDSLNRLIYTRQLMEEGETQIYYHYNSKNDISRVIQIRPPEPDSFITDNYYTYTKKGKVSQLKIVNRVGLDSSVFFIKYEYDEAGNEKIVTTYTSDMQLIQKQTYDITPISKKLLEFSTEVKLPKSSLTKGWHYYNIDAQLIKTQYSNNTWIEYVYSDNGLLDQTLSYNMEGKLNAWKTYYYEFYDGIK